MQGMLGSTLSASGNFFPVWLVWLGVPLAFLASLVSARDVPCSFLYIFKLYYDYLDNGLEFLFLLIFSTTCSIFCSTPGVAI